MPFILIDLGDKFNAGEIDVALRVDSVALIQLNISVRRVDLARRVDTVERILVNPCVIRLDVALRQNSVGFIERKHRFSEARCRDLNAAVHRIDAVLLISLDKRIGYGYRVRRNLALSYNVVGGRIDSV